MKVYEYKKCSTCRKAIKFLESQNIKFTTSSIVEEPPSKKELKLMLDYLKGRGGNLKNLFNTSGVQYRELGMANKFKEGLPEDEAIHLLSKNGKLIKRPFILGDKDGVVGFKEDSLKAILPK